MGNNFTTARITLALLELFGFVIIIAAIIAGFFALSLSPTPSQFANWPLLGGSILAVIVGVFFIASVQISRALIVTARNSAEILDLMRAQALTQKGEKAAGSTSPDSDNPRGLVARR